MFYNAHASCFPVSSKSISQLNPAVKGKLLVLWTERWPVLMEQVHQQEEEMGVGSQVVTHTAEGHTAAV